MPLLHTPTLLATLVIVVAATGFLHLIASRSNSSQVALKFWGYGQLTTALALVVLSLRAIWFDRLIVDLANAFIYLGYMLSWAGMRHFCRRPVSWPVIVLPSLIWLALCQGPASVFNMEWRLAINSAFTSGICLMTAFTLWQYRDEKLASRAPALIWMGIHATIFLVRVPIILASSLPRAQEVFSSPVVAYSLMEGMVHVTISSFLQISLTKDRAENSLRRAAETDMLTGLANRRAFFERGEAALAGLHRVGLPGAVLVIDVDRFKQINDTYGHAGGDDVLKALARAIGAHLREGDIFARMGGEEFACFLPDTSLASACVIAEGLRARVASLAIESEGRPIRTSVSIGVAATATPECDLGRLLRDADAGLYQAKRDGRDRVVASPFPLLKAS
jgi:diguanylate cyclase (GGDEF)-like protein